MTNEEFSTKFKEPKSYSIKYFDIIEYPLLLHPDNFTPMKKVEVIFCPEDILDDVVYGKVTIREATDILRLEFERMIIEQQERMTKINNQFAEKLNGNN